MENKYLKVKEILKENQMEHLLYFFDKLNEDQKELLLEDILNINFEKIKLAFDNKEEKNNYIIEPLKAIKKEDFSKEEIERIKKVGRKEIESCNLAIVTMAGGQGTRLGHNGPKGTYLLDLKRGKKYIFQIFVEKLLNIYEKYNVYLPWYIMTSIANNDETINFFEQNNYFGYPKEYVNFFKQGELPITDTKGNIVLESEDKVFKAADGNGGIFNAMFKNNIVDQLKENNIEWVLITGVDNILINFADELFIGLVKEQGKLNGVKSIEKISPEEKVGVFCKKNNHPGIIEYSEMTDSMRYEKDDEGCLKYAEANIVNHLLNIKILDKIKNESLPIHKAFKKLDFIDVDGNKVIGKEPNAYKFESFIFDYFTKVDDVTILRVKREEEFAPIKNKEGVDSPVTAAKLYDALCE